MSEINWPNMIQVVNHIYHNPKEWEQGDWWCGSKGCIAGHAAKLSMTPGETLHGTDGGFAGMPYILPSMVDVSRRAVAYLGIEGTDLQHALFNSSNTWAVIVEMLTEAAQEDDVELPAEWTTHPLTDPEEVML